MSNLREEKAALKDFAEIILSNEEITNQAPVIIDRTIPPVMCEVRSKFSFHYPREEYVENKRESAPLRDYAQNLDMYKLGKYKIDLKTISGAKSMITVNNHYFINSLFFNLVPKSKSLSLCLYELDSHPLKIPERIRRLNDLENSLGMDSEFRIDSLSSLLAFETVSSWTKFDTQAYFLQVVKGMRNYSFNFIHIPNVACLDEKRKRMSLDKFAKQIEKGKRPFEFDITKQGYSQDLEGVAGMLSDSLKILEHGFDTVTI
jgi:hypothetical protein